MMNCGRLMTAPNSLKKTALYSDHRRLNARLVPFAGYEMPVQYSGLIDEHTAVRQAAGLFDVSHMGIAVCEGPAAAEFLNTSVTRDLSPLTPGKAAYTLLCLENGGTVDDLIIYRSSNEKFYLVLNASNKEKDFAYFQRLLDSQPALKQKCQLSTLFDSHSLLALQGPNTAEILSRLGHSGGMLAPFTFISAKLDGVSVHMAFTGYTGEKGCEIFIDNVNASKLWNKILEVGKDVGIKPIGLGARDTLRTEMGYSLYGHELSETINPVEAGLSWAVGFSKAQFVGKEALVAAKAKPARKLICLKHSAKQAPRDSMPVLDSAGAVVGKITSGTFAPSLGYAIGMALVNADAQAPYTVDIRGTHVQFELTTRPFLKR